MRECEQEIPCIQEDLLARVIFGEFVCEKQLAKFIIGNLSYHIFLLEFLCLEQWLCGCVHVVIKIGKILKNRQTSILLPRQ